MFLSQNFLYKINLKSTVHSVKRRKIHFHANFFPLNQWRVKFKGINKVTFTDFFAKDARFSLTKNFFHEIISFVTSLVRRLLTQIFCQKCVIVIFRNFPSHYLCRLSQLGWVYQSPNILVHKVKAKVPILVRLGQVGWSY